MTALYEIGDSPLTLQPKILRVLKGQEFEQLGSERTVVLSSRGVINAADPKMLTMGAPVIATAAGDGLPGTVHDIELRMLREALVASNWRQSAAARKLGITPRQIGCRIHKYGLTPPGSAT